MVALAINLVMLVVMLAVIVGAWKVFVKAGKPGWAAIVPIYNVIVMCEIAGKPIWWAFVILLVPIVGMVFALLLSIEIAKTFGKGAGMGIGLFLGIGYLPLGFGDAQYQGAQG